MNTIEVSDFKFKYAGFDAQALSGVDLRVAQGQVCGIIGPNGAGKSTLCYALAGFIPHFYAGTISGTVQVAGIEVGKASLGELAGTIGIVVQNPFNQITGARFTVLEEVAFGLENLGIARDEIVARVRHALELTGLEAAADRSPYALSGGQQQRLAIASVIAMQPAVLILDEPTSQLDPVGTREVFAALRMLADQRGMTIVLVEHKLEWIAAFADSVSAMADGKVVLTGAPHEVLTDSLLDQIGVGSTRYTQAARIAQGRGLGKAESLPVTLDQAVDYFRKDAE